MKAVLLIALNYVREQRWALLLLLSWVVLSAMIIGFGRLDREDALFFIKQQAIYGVAFSAFLASSAIHNDRRSRRILAVLSKGIERSQYLAGLIVGLLLMMSVYLLTMGAFGGLMFATLRMPREHLWYLLALLMVACAVAGTTAIFFSTFAPPLLSLSMTAAALGTSAAFAQLGLRFDLLPVYSLMSAITGYEGGVSWQPTWGTVGSGVAQAVLLWLLASWIFGRRDIAVAVE